MNRKELLRQYKETPRPMGVYRIHDTVTGRSVVAASVNLPGILNRHQAQLRFGAHPDKDLQRAWNEHGPDGFTFETLDTLPPPESPDHDPASDLAALEELWLEKLGLEPDRWHSMIPKPSS